MQLLSKPGLKLKLELKDEADEENWKSLKDITCYLLPPSEEDEEKLAESRRIIRAYRGPCSYHGSMLVKAGWSLAESERVIFEVARRMDVREWMIEERRYLLSGGDGDGDIHMSG
jgi:hypothetical protein